MTVNNGGSGGGDPGGGGSLPGTGGEGGGGGAFPGTGGEGGVGGAGGAGGGGGVVTPGGRCTLPADPGICDAYFPMYYHDAETGVCRPFIYGGCDGNKNRFETIEECQAACPTSPAGLDRCEAPGDCVLVSRTCCAACDPVDEGFSAVNRGLLDAYRTETGCGGVVACAPCPEVNESDRTSQYFAATCESGRCTVVDVRRSALTECADDADCALRDGVDCCEGCDARGIVALNRSADIEGLVCSPDLGACPPCAPHYPEGMRAVCSAGRCQPQIGGAP
ncbi:BPTI/Kunitz domain-containing protein [Sorangium sp. So ce131]|uniref:BPTI/Kunitz domain-containing protein n=1 Tax=Sorangium sp. So ce131 TaxID=3133282 RepID=UPI003F611FB3